CRGPILVAAVKRQRGKSRSRGRRHRPPARLVHRDDVIFPALQRADGSVEKSRRDFLRLKRLEATQPPRPDPLEPQHDTGPAGLALLQPRIEAEIGELHLCPLYELVLRRQVTDPKTCPRSGGIVITLC